jgi:UDP-2,4-diacetamido-2,4,6-trideoxy-beta-L-altropyranose hydrolase
MAMDVAIRVDASVTIGGGHVMRCITLADEIRAIGGNAHFLCRQLTDFLRSHILATGHRLTMLPSRPSVAESDLPHSRWLGVSQEQDAEDSRAALRDRPCWLVVDHYGLDARWETELAPHAGCILAIDDLADRFHQCQALLDQNLRQDGDKAYDGKLPPKTRRLVGPRYALLRPGFRVPAQVQGMGSPPRLNLFFGSTDPLGMTLTALEALRGMDVAVDVIAGADNPLRDAIAALCQTMPQASLHVQPRDFAALLGRADLALGAGGSASWERCCLGLPTLIVSIANNQSSGTKALARAGAAIDLGEAGSVSTRRIADAVGELLSNPKRLAAMRAAAKGLVDGRGAERVALYMMRDKVRLRAAVTDDAEPKWQWRNDERTRRYSRDPRPVDLARHLNWWQSSLVSDTRTLLIAHYGCIDVGVLRFDIEHHLATVSIYLDPDMTGLGLGPAILRVGMIWLHAQHPGVRDVLAEIDENNVASAASFARAGFHKDTNQLWKWRLP